MVYSNTLILILAIRHDSFIYDVAYTDPLSKNADCFGIISSMFSSVLSVDNCW
jgi:hypothetical protein